MSLWKQGEVSLWNYISTSSFILIPHQPFCFTPGAPAEIFYFRHFVQHVFLSTNSFLHTFFVCSFAFFFSRSILSMLSWTSSGIITFVIKLLSSLSLPSLDLNNENAFFKAIFSWYTYFSWRVIVLSVSKCWWMLLIYVMPNIFSVCCIWSTQAVLYRQCGGGGRNISERRTPLSHLLGRCEPPRRVTLHRGVVLGWGTRQVDQTQTYEVITLCTAVQISQFNPSSSARLAIPEVVDRPCWNRVESAYWSGDLQKIFFCLTQVWPLAWVLF